MTLPDILTTLVIWVAVPLNWLVTVLLWRLSRRAPDVRSLRVVAVTSTCIALIVTVFGIVFVNNGMEVPPLNAQATQILARSSLLVLSVVPPVYLLRWYRRENGH